MRRQSLSRLRLLLFVSLSGVSLSLTSAQQIHAATAIKTSNGLSNPIAQFVAVPEIRPLPAYGRLSQTFAADQGSAKQVRFPSFNPSYAVGNAPNKRPVDVFIESKETLRKVCPKEDLQYFGRRIPWAGWIIQRVDEQAKAHPRVTRVFQFVKLRSRGTRVNAIGRGPFR